MAINIKIEIKIEKKPTTEKVWQIPSKKTMKRKKQQTLITKISPPPDTHAYLKKKSVEKNQK